MPEKILLVEDEPAIADNIAYALKSRGYQVCRSSTGSDAVERLHGDAIDCVLLDVGLPDCDGLDLCREIRTWTWVPVIFVTARSNEIDRVLGLEMGADDFLVKPFSLRELTARVKAVLRRTSGRFPLKPQGAASPFAIDKRRMRISYFGAPLSLSRYEFRLLEILVKRPGWVFSRSRLMELAWEEPAASTERTVDTHIKTIRAKLRSIRSGRDPIQTHRGLGYSLKDSG